MNLTNTTKSMTCHSVISLTLLAVMAVAMMFLSSGCDDSRDDWKNGFYLWETEAVGDPVSVEADLTGIPDNIVADLKAYRNKPVIISSQKELDSFIGEDCPDVEKMFDAPLLGRETQSVDFQKNSILICYSISAVAPRRVNPMLFHMMSTNSFRLDLVFSPYLDLWSYPYPGDDSLQKKSFYIVRTVCKTLRMDKTGNWTIQVYEDDDLK